MNALETIIPIQPATDLVLVSRFAGLGQRIAQ